MRHTYIDINQANLTHNLNTIKTLAPTARIMAMVKSGAYGHGVANCLSALMGADAFGVATLGEGLEVFHLLQLHNHAKPVVLIEGVFNPHEWQIALEHDFGCVIHCKEQLDWALQNVPPDGSFTRTIWLKYNTGMNRLGFGLDELIEAGKCLNDKGYRLILTSHFACADDKDHPTNTKQIDRFNEALSHLNKLCNHKVQGSLCNSAGIIHFPHVHHDWVRAGIALYGGTPITEYSAHQLNLRPVMTFSTQIIATHKLDVGEQVGYGGLWTAQKPSTIGILSVGYGDGYPRAITSGKVLIIKNNKHHIAPIIGRVAMDMMMIDMTDLPIEKGDTAILWGEGLSADEVADWANTISYELFCQTMNRPTRRIV
ncbi:MAG: alanine racemase [Moraxella sp.]|uniref:alanine racemase n=1 Tax=Moraxella sp. TaxID=479 RepID=UPI0026DAE075|nr:alanine racemase [Moraxella sp.]MDO4449370.1 alanine racemase [Moraxella sp.]